MIQKPVTYELIPLPLPPASFTKPEDDKPEVSFEIQRTPIYRITEVE